MGIKIGIVGFGEFSESFLDIFLTHPLVDEVVGAEIMSERREYIQNRYGLKKMYASYDEMLENEDSLDSVGIFTQRHQHGPMIIKALNMNKHVFSAVPMSCEINEAFEIIELVKKKKLTYMSAETCYYFPCAIYCREKYKSGAFGKFVYGESQYYHDITEMFDSFSGSGGDSWKRIAGIPPMYYSTHSMSMMFLSIGEYPTEVSCFGFEDTIGDGIYGVGKNNWDNPFSNESALFKMSGGGVCRINEFRRCGTCKPSSYITSLVGTHANYQCAGMHHTFTTGPVFGQEGSVEYVSNLINSKKYVSEKNNINLNTEPIKYDYHRGYSAVHDLSRLPAAHRAITDGGHNGSHAFLVDDFVRAVVTNKLPPNNAWDSALCMIPGIIAHESAIKGGETLKIPYIGTAPQEFERLDYNDIKYDD